VRHTREQVVENAECSCDERAAGSIRATMDTLTTAEAKANDYDTLHALCGKWEKAYHELGAKHDALEARIEAALAVGPYAAPVGCHFCLREAAAILRGDRDTKGERL
jgi:hypothetical protein